MSIDNSVIDAGPDEVDKATPALFVCIASAIRKIITNFVMKFNNIDFRHRR